VNGAPGRAAGSAAGREGRAAALAAIAAATGRNPAATATDRPSGTTVVDDGVAAPMELLEADGPHTPGVWLFDDAPTDPPGSLPHWSGFLVRIGLDGEATVVRLGDRAELRERWPDLVAWLTADELANVIARYFGRDAGIEAHQTVLRSADSVRAITAPAERSNPAFDGIVPPRLVIRDDGGGALAFLTSFVERETPNGANRIGVCRWRATWGARDPVAWNGHAVVRGIPSVFGT
jgi:hypothetical protein